jgi:histidine ammonia-lyase
VDPHLNGGLPAFLGGGSGLESGLMLLQYTAAALVSENKVLAHPASVDSIPTSGNQEDHVSMGPIAGRHARTVLEAVQRIVAIELLCAARALDLRLADPAFASAAPGAGVAEARRRMLAVTPAWVADREPGPEIEAATRLVRGGALAELAVPG